MSYIVTKVVRILPNFGVTYVVRPIVVLFLNNLIFLHETISLFLDALREEPKNDILCEDKYWLLN